MPGSYGLLNENFREPLIGGAELQLTMIAKKLAQDFDISFIVYDHGQISPEKINGIEIFKSFSIEDFPKRKYFKIIYSTFKSLKKANADIYITRSGRVFPSIVAFYCYLTRKKFIYSFASDMDLDLDDFGNIELILFKFLLYSADLITTSDKFQNKQLKEVFGKDSIIINNAYVLKSKIPEKNGILTVLWVSTLRKDWKNPELYLELAKKFPDIKFIMIGGPDPEDPEFYAEINNKTSEIPNLDFIGFVPFKEVDNYYSEASIIVNTSNVEGFPHTFLQAWERQTPVLSLNIDPDGIICNYNLGIHSKTFEKMIKDLKRLIDDKNLRYEMGENGRRYVEQRHDLNVIIDTYKKTLQNLI